MGNKELFKPYLALAAICFFWGTTYLAIRVGIESIPPFQFAGIRFIIAGLVMCGYFLLKGHAFPKRRELINLSITGILLFLGGNMLVVWAEKQISSGLAALICSTTPFWVIGMNLLLNRSERINLNVIIGLILGFAGLAIIFYDNVKDIANPEYTFSIVCIIIANIAWALGTVFAKRNPAKIHTLFGAGIQMLAGGIVIQLIGITGGEAIQFTMETDGLLALIYLIVIGSILTYSAYVYALSKLPATVVILYAYINPIVAVILGWLLLNERLTSYTIVAMFITLGGVYIVNQGFKGQKPEKLGTTGNPDVEKG